MVAFYSWIFMFILRFLVVWNSGLGCLPFLRTQSGGGLSLFGFFPRPENASDISCTWNCDWMSNWLSYVVIWQWYELDLQVQRLDVFWQLHCTSSEHVCMCTNQVKRLYTPGMTPPEFCPLASNCKLKNANFWKHSGKPYKLRAEGFHVHSTQVVW
jgi:hypothetical protein